MEYLLKVIKLPKLELTEREVQTLNGILLIEEDDLKDLTKNSDDNERRIRTSKIYKS